jgi:hypothetical protein
MGFEVDARRGVQNHYGVRVTNLKSGGRIEQSVLKQLEYVFNFNDLPTGTLTNLDAVIPAFSKIVSAKLEVLTAFAGGTSYVVGLNNASTGVAVDADGLLTAAQLPLANIDARGDFITGAGALVGVSVGAAAVDVAVVATGTFTAGKARLIVEYLPEGV